jgi:hypothetical protein
MMRFEQAMTILLGAFELRQRGPTGVGLTE